MRETLEEAINRISKEDGYDIEGTKVADFVDGMVKGAKWQQERSYSEEEVIELLNKREDCINQTSSIFDYTTATEWFKQFKK